MSITFDVDKVNISKNGFVHQNNWIENKFNSIDPSIKDFEFLPEKIKNKFIEKYANKTILFESYDINRHDYLKASKINSFIDAVYTAYQYHYPLVLSPDDIWLCIIQGISQHINQNANSLRKEFVDFDGKKELILRRDNFIKGSPNNDWHGVFKEFSEQLEEFIGYKRHLFECNFSTTGEIEKAASRVTLMDAMQNYFEYIVMTLCGIPKITLLGEKSDWLNIISKIQNFPNIGLQNWFDKLVSILTEIVSTFDHVNVNFWQKFFKEIGGSGGDRISGWINVFFPYLHDNSKNPYIFDYDGYDGISPNKYPSGLSQAPFIWKYYDQKFDMKFIAGFLTVNQNPTTLEVSPAIGWCIGEK